MIQWTHANIDIKLWIYFIEIQQHQRSAKENWKSQASETESELSEFYQIFVPLIGNAFVVVRVYRDFMLNIYPRHSNTCKHKNVD